MVCYMCVYCYHIIITSCNKVSKIQEKNCKINDCSSITTTRAWCNDHSTSIRVCGVWGARVRVQVSKIELYTHIYLD